jgi:hypothetical protein
MGAPFGFLERKRLAAERFDPFSEPKRFVSVSSYSADAARRHRRASSGWSFPCKHVPDLHEHMVRYYGRYSSRTRGSEHERPDMDGVGPEAESHARRAAKIAWAMEKTPVCHIID